jgi:hypothetical protein
LTHPLKLLASRERPRLSRAFIDFVDSCIKQTVHLQNTGRDQEYGDTDDHANDR